MPELPEVETIKRQLHKELVGAKIKEVQVINGKKINVSRREFVRALEGAKVIGVNRRAKMLLINFDNGWSAVIHLIMTGRLLIKSVSDKVGPHTFVIFTLSTSKKLFWEDVRKFGYLKLIKTNKLEDFFHTLGIGPEPLQASFTAKTLTDCLKRFSSKKIKPLLLEQRCLAGIGNIYAAEILAYAGVHPERRVKEVPAAKINKMHTGMKKILTEAILRRGSSADDYVDAYGESGEFVPKLKVYGREGEKCFYCKKGIIKKFSLAGRGTYFCPIHQK